MIQRVKGPEKAILVGVCHKEQRREQLQEYMDELTMLCQTAGATPVKIFTQNLHHFDPAFLIGSGKVNEIKKFIEENKEVDLVIFDDELSPSQQRNLEKE